MIPPDEDSPRRGRRKSSRKAVRVGRTHLGRAVFAERDHFSDELIDEIRGTVIDEIDYSSDYCMDMGDDRCLEPDAPFRYLNHSCEPNCRFDWFDIRKDGSAELSRRVFLTAVEDIRRGDELTIDYRWPPQMAIPCRCHMPSCRGWIVAAEDLPELLASASQADA